MSTHKSTRYSTHLEHLLELLSRHELGDLGHILNAREVCPVHLVLIQLVCGTHAAFGDEPGCIGSVVHVDVTVVVLFVVLEVVEQRTLHACNGKRRWQHHPVL
jgi:hypothetical protein